jgi:hypothetical protein
VVPLYIITQLVLVQQTLKVISASAYNNMISLLANQDDYRFNVLLTPGLFASETAIRCFSSNYSINNTQNSGDNIL